MLTHSQFGYEIGAGRFGSKHKLLLNLIKEFNLVSKIVPISDEIKYIDTENHTITTNKFRYLFNQLKVLLSPNINKEEKTTKEYLSKKSE